MLLYCTLPLYTVILSHLLFWANVCNPLSIDQFPFGVYSVSIQLKLQTVPSFVPFRDAKKVLASGAVRVRGEQQMGWVMSGRLAFHSFHFPFNMINQQATLYEGYIPCVVTMGFCINAFL